MILTAIYSDTCDHQAKLEIDLNHGGFSVTVSERLSGKTVVHECFTNRRDAARFLDEQQAIYSLA